MPSMGSKIARVVANAPMAIATKRLNLPQIPHEIPDNVPAIAKMPHKRQNSASGYSPTKNSRKLLLTTDHWAIVVVQFQIPTTIWDSNQTEIRVKILLNQLSNRFFFAHWLDVVTNGAKLCGIQKSYQKLIKCCQDYAKKESVAK